MKWGAVLGIVAVVALITLYEWQRMNPNKKKEKIAFISLVGIGSILAILLIFSRTCQDRLNWLTLFLSL